MMLRGIGDGAFDFSSDGSAGVFSNYGPVILHDGTTISDPANTPATAAQCAPYKCGVDSGNAAAIFWCGYWGQEAFGGAQPCLSPTCAPYVSQIPGCSIIAPSPAEPAAPLPTPTYPAPVLTPQNIAQPLPDITQVNAAVPVQTQSSCWCTLNSLIEDNPVIAVLILGATTALLLKKGKR
jgi:hypothetical protein